MGICCVCGREQVTHDGEKVLHGYQRPGYGWIVGGCYGTRKQAYNLSCEPCSEYKTEVLLPYQRDARKRLADLKNDKVDSLTEANHLGESKTFTRTDNEFPKLHKREIAYWSRQIEQVRDEIMLMDRLVAGWKPKPLRGAA